MDKPLSRVSLRPEQLVARILEEPELVTTVRALKPEVLGKLVEFVGLEDAGEIVSLATTEQLVHMFDSDLWKSDGGLKEEFDADRFALWLEVMLEAGEKFTAQKLSELPEELVVLAFSRNILVLDLDNLEREMAGLERWESDLTDKALENRPSFEFGEYLVVSKAFSGWDAILAVLAELNESNFEFFSRVMEKCSDASEGYIENNGGLYSVLTSEETLEEDAAGDREERRAVLGFISPADAAAFLKLALVTALEMIVESKERDPITRRYFRTLGNASQPDERRTGGVARLHGILRDAGIEDERFDVPLLGSKKTGGESAKGLFKSAMANLGQSNPELYSRRMSELAYLANVLCAGCTLAGRDFRPLEAAEAAVDVCDKGLEYLIRKSSGKSKNADASRHALEIAARDGAQKLFSIGWKLLHDESPGDAFPYRIKTSGKETEL